jgi:hypothetical protein
MGLGAQIGSALAKSNLSVYQPCSDSIFSIGGEAGLRAEPPATSA